jgi:LysM repeat protein
MKRRLFIFMIVLLFGSIACGAGDNLPTRAPAENATENDGTPAPDESPRIGPDADLPPTWTPVPTIQTDLGAAAGEEASTVQDPTPITLTGDEETYIVQPGDTLAEIAAAFGVTLDALVEANNIENIDVIEVDDVLIIPK